MYEDEEWRTLPIEGLDGYSVSTYGRIRRNAGARINGRIYPEKLITGRIASGPGSIRTRITDKYGTAQTVSITRMQYQLFLNNGRPLASNQLVLFDHDRVSPDGCVHVNDLELGTCSDRARLIADRKNELYNAIYKEIIEEY